MSRLKHQMMTVVVVCPALHVAAIFGQGLPQQGFHHFEPRRLRRPRLRQPLRLLGHVFVRAFQGVAVQEQCPQGDLREPLLRLRRVVVRRQPPPIRVELSMRVCHRFGQLPIERGAFLLHQSCRLDPESFQYYWDRGQAGAARLVQVQVALPRLGVAVQLNLPRLLRVALRALAHEQSARRVRALLLDAAFPVQRVAALAPRVCPHRERPERQEVDLAVGALAAQS